MMLTMSAESAPSSAHGARAPDTSVHWRGIIAAYCDAAIYLNHVPF